MSAVYAALGLLSLALLIISGDAQSCTQGSVRLVGGSGPWEGNVQVCNNGVWGWVCDDSWGTSDAYVVCRQLGYSTTGAIYRYGSYYGWGTGKIWLNYAYCSGSESNLLSCSNAYGLGAYYCSYSEIAGVACPSGGSSCTNGQLRLLSSYSYYGRSEGRVEYCHNGVWGTVCDDSWGSADAQVVCRQLGYSASGAQAYSNAYFGQGSGNIWLDDLRCSGSESTITNCPKNCIGCHNCGHYEDAGARCYGSDSASCTNNAVRIWSAYDDTPSNEGILQICKSGTWYAMCHSYYSCYVGKIACQQLGYAGAITLRSNAGFYYGYWNNNDRYRYNCYSYHTSLSQCYTYYSYSCGYYNDALGIVCSSPSSGGSNCTSGTVRLMDGTELSTNEGRVEYCYNNGWAPVCSLNSYAANLMCKSLGFTQFTWGSIVSDERYGRSDITSDFNYLNCYSNHHSLSDCYTYTKGSGSCYITQSTCSTEYGLRCYNPGSCTDGQLRLYNGTIQQEGRAEVCINGVWSAICQSGFNTIDAYVFCASLGYTGGHPTIYYTATFGETNGPIAWSYLYCYGWEQSVFDCSKSQYPYFTCSYPNTVGITCKEDCANGEVRVVGGGHDNEGTVEVCNNNIWGLISDNTWTNYNARVVCNQLGYPDGFAMPVTGSKYGKPNKTIHYTDVTCTGMELNVAECSKTILSLYSGKLALPTTSVAGVDCIYDVPTEPPCVPKPAVTPGSCTDGSVRLVTSTGSVSTETGRAEYCYNSNWTPFCKMDSKVASVICRQFGHTQYSWATIDASGSFGLTTNYSLFDNFTCGGNENNIASCSLNEASDQCTPWCPFSNIGLRCFDTGSCTEGGVRLADGIIENEGRVEMCINGVWGGICDDGWDTTDAHIVCTQLGHPELEPIVYSNSYFGDGNYPIIFSNMGCGGWEKNIGACQKSSYSNFDCTRDNTAGVLCGYDCNNGDVRLVGGNGAYEGTVEVCFENIWGLVSESGWTQTDAEVVCKQLGYQTQGTVLQTNSYYGKPAKTILISNALCTGTEEKLSDCTLSTLSLEDGKAALATTSVAGVQCYTPNACFSPVTGGSSCVDKQLRISGPNSQSGEGNLEYCYKGTWSPFCSLGPNEATVACRQLGFTDTEFVSVFTDGRYGSMSSTSQFMNFSCSSNRVEFKLDECALIDSCQSSCPYGIGIRCAPMGNCQDGDVRLVNGSIVQEGRVEVCYNNLWGPLCGDGFDKSDAFVICRELGLGDSEPTVYTNSYYGDGSGPILYSNMDCGGYENTIVNCDKSTYGSFTCSRNNIAGVACQDSCADGDVKLVGGMYESEGTVEICYGNLWGTVVDTNWNDINAQVVCSQLGYNSPGSTGLVGSAYGKPNKTVHLNNVACNGTETKLSNCKADSIPLDTGRDLYMTVSVAGVKCVDPNNVGIGELSDAGDVTGIAIVAVVSVAFVIAVLIIISLVAYIGLKQRSSNNEFRRQSMYGGGIVTMSGVSDRGVENPLADEESVYDSVSKDKLVQAMEKEFN